MVTFLQAFLGVPPVPLLGPLGHALMALSLAVLALAALSGREGPTQYEPPVLKVLNDRRC